MNDKQILSFTKSFRSGILSGKPPHKMCYAICAPLSTLLRMSGIENELIEGEIKISKNETWGHYWLKLKDGRILDPTASQFNNGTTRLLPPIYLGSKPNFYKILIS